VNEKTERVTDVATEQEKTTPKPKHRWLQYSIWTMLVLGLVPVLALVVSYLGFAIRDAREAARRTTCHGLRLGMLTMALQNYHDEFHCFPPAFVADKNGRPMHSWRVLVLQNLDRDLYSRYDFSEPWDGPKNRLLWKDIPLFYRCPSYRGQNPFSTNYVAVVGPDTAWPGEKSVNYKDMTDGSDRTLLLVEVADSDINWMEPRDMPYSQAIAGVNVDTKLGISSNHPGGAMGGLADDFSLFLPDDASPAAIKALLTIQGDEPWDVFRTVLGWP
jgi:hypothetical protein